MIAVAPSGSRLRAPSERARQFVPVAAITALVTAFAPAGPGDPGVASVALVVGVVALLGIPHGAVDHLVGVGAGSDEETPGGVLRFHLQYLAAMAGYGVLWLLAPGVALAVFLLASIHHFGQSDLAHLGLRRSRQLVLQWSRGLFLVGLPLAAHLAAVSPTIATLGGGDPTSWAWFTDHRELWCALLVAQHVVVGAIVLVDLHDRRVMAMQATTVVLLAVLFVRTDPLVGFAVYFGLWHSLAHLRVLARTLDGSSDDGVPMSLVRLLRLATPRSAPVVVGLGALVAGAVIFDRVDLVVPAAFVVVSLVTPPHLVVVERLWRSAADGSVETQDAGRPDRAFSQSTDEPTRPHAPRFGDPRASDRGRRRSRRCPRPRSRHGGRRPRRPSPGW